MELDWFSRVIDTYERKARLYPALLAVVPPAALAVFLFGVMPKKESGLIGLMATFGVLYLFASIAREFGKRLENSLFDSWGGKPTTQLLRHRDKTIDPITKARYHAFLAKHLGVSFPSPDEEEGNADAADATYQAGAKWLLDKTRDSKKFNLLFQENVAYGFRRNCLGLKPVAM